MTSSVTNFSSRIDINYPVVGKDNDTQGFRDNFSNIQSAFIIASTEISDLQDNGVKLSQDNNFNYHIIQNAVLKNTSLAAATTVIINTTTDYKTIDYAQANYHKFRLANTSGARYCSLSFINWPTTSTYGSITVEIQPVFTTTATINMVGNINLLGPNTFPRTYNVSEPILYEVWTTDNGATIYVMEITGV